MQEPSTFFPSQISSKCFSQQVSLLFNYSSPVVANKFISNTHFSLLFNYSILSSNLISFKSSIHIQLSLQQMNTPGNRNAFQALFFYSVFRRLFFLLLDLNWLKQFSKRYLYITHESCTSGLFIWAVSSGSSSCPSPGGAGVLNVRVQNLVPIKMYSL